MHAIGAGDADKACGYVAALGATKPIDLVKTVDAWYVDIGM